jgi:hypothetical protein
MEAALASIAGFWDSLPTAPDLDTLRQCLRYWRYYLYMAGLLWDGAPHWATLAPVAAAHPAVERLQRQLDALQTRVATSTMVQQTRDTITGAFVGVEARWQRLTLAVCVAGLAVPIAAVSYYQLLQPRNNGVPMLQQLVPAHRQDEMQQQRDRLPEHTGERVVGTRVTCDSCNCSSCNCSSCI